VEPGTPPTLLEDSQQEHPERALATHGSSSTVPASASLEEISPPLEDLERTPEYVASPIASPATAARNAEALGNAEDEKDAQLEEPPPGHVPSSSSPDAGEVPSQPPAFDFRAEGVPFEELEEQQEEQPEEDDESEVLD
jgi:hypothetical protein